LILKELYERPLFRPFCSLIGCIPVRRDGRDLAATRAALRALGEGRVVPVFPEGRISPTSGRELGPGRPGVAFLALHAKVPVIPAYISGTPETNQVGPSFRTRSHARVRFGPPIDLSEFYEEGVPIRDRLQGVTDRLMESIRELKQQVDGKVEASKFLAYDLRSTEGGMASDGHDDRGDSEGVSGARTATGRA
jgi:1-acyl-sn-glycerol-3-phosphate acyltransferase